MKGKDATLGLGHFLQQAPRDDTEAVGPQLNFTYAPKTFSRKFFMHFEGIEQLEKGSQRSEMKGLAKQMKARR